MPSFFTKITQIFIDRIAYIFRIKEISKMKGIIILRNIFILSLLIICFPKICVSQNFQEVLVISSKVGPVIDSLEKKQYNLFPEHQSNLSTLDLLFGLRWHFRILISLNIET